MLCYSVLISYLHSFECSNMTESKLHLRQIHVILISGAFDQHDILKVRKKYMVKAVCIDTT